MLLASADANAQLPRGFDSLSAHSVADSLNVIDSLNANIRRNPKDTHALHRRGMIAWALEMRSRHPAAPPMPPAASLRKTADGSLFAALSLDRASGRRWLNIAHFYRSDPIGAAATAAKDAFRRTIEIAQAGGDSSAGANAALVLAGALGTDFGLSGSLPAPPDIVPLERDGIPVQSTPGRAQANAPPTPAFTPRPPPLDSDSTMTIDYTRRVPYAPVVVENVVVSLGETPAGSYRLTVTLRDVATGRSVSRSTRFVIRNP